MRRSDDLQKSWKIVLPATLAGRIEFMLADTLHHKTIYGARARLLTALLERWIAEQEGRPIPTVPSILDLRS